MAECYPIKQARMLTSPKPSHTRSKGVRLEHYYHVDAILHQVCTQIAVVNI